jgi:hypothetical protein
VSMLKMSGRATEESRAQALASSRPRVDAQGSRRAAEESRAQASISRRPRVDAQESRRAAEERRDQASDSRRPRVDAQDEQTRYRAEQCSEKSGAQRRAELRSRIQVDRVSMLRRANVLPS